MKFRCLREIVAASGDQEFEVEADSEEEARELFRQGRGELVVNNCEVTDLGEYDLDNIWEE